MLPAFFESVVDLITRTSTDLPPDVRAAMSHALAAEAPGTRAGQAMTIIAQNIDQAESCEGPICQDTGMPTFEVKVPLGANQIWMRRQIREAVAEATRRGKLRPNSVDSITGENSGQQPRARHADHPLRSVGRAADIEIKLILKGGGCENTNAQYSLPASSIIWAAPTARSRACGSAFCTPCGRPRARGAARAPSACASAAIAPRATRTRRNSCSARSTIAIPIRGWRRSKNRSWKKRTGSR